MTEFIKAYNFACGCSFVIESWPEDEVRNSPAVEALCRDRDRVMAIEHTLAQPFVGERQDSAAFRRALVPIEFDDSLLQPGFDITIRTDVGAIPVGVNWDGIATLVQEWLRRALPTLSEGTSRHQVPVSGVELGVTVEKVFDDIPGFPGSVFLMRNAPEDTLRSVLETALRHKLPKLRAANADLRILLLERADVLGGYHRFRDSLRRLLAEQFLEMRPDEVWLVNTVGLERENALFFYKVWPTYFEHRVQRNSEGVFRKM